MNKVHLDKEPPQYTHISSVHAVIFLKEYSP